MKDKFPRDGNSIALAADRSPRIKRAKLTSDLDSNQENYLSGNSPSLGGHNVKMASSGSAEDYSNAEGDSAAQITVGFDNLGNTCFMNSPLQCLSSLEPLSIDFQTAVAEFGPELRPNSITRLLYLLMKDVRKLDVCPERVRQILVRLRHDINGKFALNTQQDAHELLAELLDRTDEEVKAVMGARQAHSDMASGSAGGAPSTILADSGASSGTPIQSNFMWFYKTSFYFHECKTEITSSQEERDTTLMLALNSDKDYSLQDCIDRYFESSEVEMKCDKCGKDEKATMTRKIVKRPRIFILNLLRYQTDITESKKKMDKVNIPRYMSIAEYCADDVKAPPYMEPVFMLDRMCADDTQHMDQNMSNTLPQEGGHGQDSRHFSFSEKEKPDEVTDGAGQRNGTADDCGADVGVDKKAGDSEHQSKGQNTRLSKGRKVVLSVPDDVQDTKLLVKTLISKFWEVENYIQEYGEEAAMLYVETSAVITEVNSRIERQRKVTEPTNDESGSAANQSDHSPTHQVAVCHLLMNLALGSDEDEIETALDDDHCEMICKDIFLTRYSSYDKEDKKRDHLIENLCLYLAAKKLGIAKPDTPKKTMRSPEAARAGHSTDRVEWKDQSQAESPVDSMVNSPESDDEISFKSLPSKDTEGCAVVDEKRKTEHSQSENLGESSSGNRIITVTSVMPKGREKHRDESKVAGSLAVSTSHHVRAVPAQQEHQYFGLPNVPNFNLIQDRDFSCYTEEELQSVDLASLTEDEMMQYAQALSKLQYVRDQKAKPDDDCPMELCDLSQDEAMSPNISDLANECDHLSEVLQDSSSLGPSPSGMKLTTERNQSSSHTAAVLQQSVFSDACVPTIKEMASTQGNEQPNEVQLTCEENLSDLDEPDGLVQIDTPLIKDYYKSKDVVKTDIKNSLKCHSTPARDDYYYDYGMLNQADFGSQPMDMNMSFPESQSLFCDTPSEAKSERQSPKVLLDKCNTSSENGKSHKKISRLDADNGETVHKSTSDTKCSPSTMTDKLPKSQPDSTDHVVPSSAHPSPRKDSYLFSPSKPNNLTKTRDYSRLRSPSASPRKRNNRTQSRSSSATKKLLFPADERGAKTSANTELESFLDFPKNSFLEVNIDDNFILDRNEDCVITSASVETSRPAAFSPTIRKKLNNSHVISPSVSKHTSKLEPTAAAQPLVESVQAEPAHPKPDAGADSHEPSVSFARVEKFASNEKLQENTNSERSQATGKSRTVRSGCFSSTEEKENDPADLARNKRLENIELGKADFSYRLVGIVNHHGESLYAGHYTAFAYNLSKQKWFYMDDRHTKETTEMTARRDSLNSGYVFFYMDKDLFHEYAEKVGETSAAKFQS
ncbi:unnamed protein product [Lymnaea stagnalis]|uniref:ubiquitinyl hydrolase 1 n=1 Tax=Lymnaea stagnalis TaxID=6523 RepID=A0AAV2IJP3_LYMST